MSGTAVGVSKEHITKTPGVCGGRACIAGHRIRVSDIAGMYERRGMSADEIVDQLPGITLADVHAAMAYYYDHRDEVEADLRAELDTAARLAHLFPSKRADTRTKRGV